MIRLVKDTDVRPPEREALRDLERAAVFAWLGAGSLPSARFMVAWSRHEAFGLDCVLAAAFVFLAACGVAFLPLSRRRRKRPPLVPAQPAMPSAFASRPADNDTSIG